MEVQPRRAEAVAEMSKGGGPRRRRPGREMVEAERSEMVEAVEEAEEEAEARRSVELVVAAAVEVVEPARRVGRSIQERASCCFGLKKEEKCGLATAV